MDQNGRVPLEHGIRGKLAEIHREALDAIDHNALTLGTFLPRLGLSAFPLGGVVGGSVRIGLAGAIGWDSGLALLPLEPADFVAEALHLGTESEVLGVQMFHEVEQALHGSASGLVGDGLQIEIKQFQGIGSVWKATENNWQSRGRVRLKRIESQVEASVASKEGWEPEGEPGLRVGAGLRRQRTCPLIWSHPLIY